MKILRLTRHTAEPKQLDELRRIFGEGVEVIERAETVQSAAEVKAIVEESQAEVLEAVLPLPLLAEVTNPRTGLQIPVIRASMIRRLQADGSAVFNFDHYEKVVRVEIVTELL